VLALASVEIDKLEGVDGKAPVGVDCHTEEARVGVDEAVFVA